MRHREIIIKVLASMHLFANLPHHYPQYRTVDALGVRITDYTNMFDKWVVWR